MQQIREEELGNGKRVEIDQRSSHVNRGIATNLLFRETSIGYPISSIHT
jgi:hypothetical protein